MFDEQHQDTAAPDGERDEAALAGKVRFLSRVQSYASATGGVIARETHMSWVFMVGDRVYKLKKPVHFSYLDFSTLERRAAACRAEYVLNRRLAPNVYLDVVPLTATSTGYAIAGDDAIVDWLVVMRRLNENETLETALSERSVTLIQVDRLAATLSAFYLHAPRISISPDAHQAFLSDALARDLGVLLDRRFGLRQGQIDCIARVQRRFIKERWRTLADRIHGRHIVDAHGDLRPEHIWLSNSCPIIDCLEFDARLRAVDALDEIAFLHLECERLGGRWVGERVRKRLSRVLNDDAESGLFLFYRTRRAILRARLSIAHLADPKPRTPEKWPRIAHAYLRLASVDARRLEQLLDSKRATIQDTRRSANGSFR